MEENYTNSLLLAWKLKSMESIHFEKEVTFYDCA